MLICLVGDWQRMLKRGELGSWIVSWFFLTLSKHDSILIGWADVTGGKTRLGRAVHALRWWSPPTLFVIAGFRTRLVVLTTWSTWMTPMNSWALCSLILLCASLEQPIWVLSPLTREPLLIPLNPQHWSYSAAPTGAASWLLRHWPCSDHSNNIYHC